MRCNRIEALWWKQFENYERFRTNQCKQPQKHIDLKCIGVAADGGYLRTIQLKAHWFPLEKWIFLPFHLPKIPLIFFSFVSRFVCRKKKLHWNRSNSLWHRYSVSVPFKRNDKSRSVMWHVQTMQQMLSHVLALYPHQMIKAFLEQNEHIFKCPLTIVRSERALAVPNMCESSTLVVFSGHMPRTHSLFRACIAPLARSHTDSTTKHTVHCTCTTSATAHVYNDTKRKRRRILSKKKRREVKKKKKRVFGVNREKIWPIGLLYHYCKKVHYISISIVQSRKRVKSRKNL